MFYQFIFNHIIFANCLNIFLKNQFYSDFVSVASVVSVVSVFCVVSVVSVDDLTFDTLTIYEATFV